MAKHPTSKKVHRTSDQPDDAFVAGVERTVEWAKANRTVVTVAVVALVLLVASGLYYVNYQRTLETQATARLNEIQASIGTSNAQLAARDLEGFVNRFGSTEAGRQARLILADILLNNGRGDEAVDALDDLADDFDQPYGIPAARLLAAAYEATGQPDRAVQTYQRLADNARFPYQRREALANAARVRLQSGDPAAAVTLYDRALDTFEEGEAGRGYYEMWRAEAAAMAANGGAVAPVSADTSAAAAASSDTAGSTNQ